MPVNIKLTNRVAIEIALSTLPTNKSFTVDSATFSADEVKAKLEAMLTAYEKKAAAPKKPTKTQAENAPIKDILLATLTCWRRLVWTSPRRRLRPCSASFGWMARLSASLARARRRPPSTLSCNPFGGLKKSFNPPKKPLDNLPRLCYNNIVRK